jgi:hypothetical protein
MQDEDWMEDMKTCEVEERERTLAMLVRALEGHLERSKGDIAFSHSQLRRLRSDGHVLEPRRMRYTRI